MVKRYSTLIIILNTLFVYYFFFFNKIKYLKIILQIEIRIIHFSHGFKMMKHDLIKFNQ